MFTKRRLYGYSDLSYEGGSCISEVGAASIHHPAGSNAALLCTLIKTQELPKFKLGNKTFPLIRISFVRFLMFVFRKCSALAAFSYKEQ